jgi:hypothetical protein
MRTGYAFLAALSLSLSQCASANFYLKDKWVGTDFFEGWTWETENDPTHGQVNYVDQADALLKNLSYGTFHFISLLPAIRVPFDRDFCFSGQ